MKYAARYATQAAAAAMLAVLAVACDPSAVESPKSPGNTYANMLTDFSLIARGVAAYEIYSVTPPQGPLAGGNPATLSGVFPFGGGVDPVTEAMAAYTVYFGANIAPYDLGMGQPFTASDIFVTVPAGAALGFVDVLLRRNSDLTDMAALPNGYEYIDAAFDIYDVNPDIGPNTGGQQVTITGSFPIAGPILTVAEADASYRVFFDTAAASFDPSVSPVITTTEMFVITPPHPVGLVDVSVETVEATPRQRVLPDGYEYIDAFEILAVDPSVGPTAGGQQVTITGRFPIANPILTVAEADAIYSVFFDTTQAVFDPSVSPVITSTQMFVITPAHALGLVDVSVESIETVPQQRVLPDGYLYRDFEIDAVVPDTGWIFGFEPVNIQGSFPVTQAFIDTVTAANAADYYYVQFGNRLGQFDPFVPPPVISTTDMFVLSPPAENVGFVDVSVGAFDDFGSVIEFDTLSAAYRYYGMYLLRCIPNQGPLIGGNLVRLEGVFPGLAAITDVYEAYSIYDVRFGANRAPFADVSPGPCFFPSQIDTIAQTYTIGYMYVFAPPGDAPGLVDVRIEDLLDIDLPTTLIDGYEYLESDGIQRWDDAVIQPNPIGKLLAGELLVTIEGLGSVERGGSGIGPAFIVPQGGVPANQNHRILLQEVSYQETGSQFTWQGTNIDAIERIMNEGGADELLVDGHAAVFLFADAEGIEIIGDSLDPTDGGLIQVAAQQGRHAIIDTIPPRLLAFSGTLRGDDLVSTDQAGSYLISNVPLNPPPFDTLHPYLLPTPADHPGATFDAPFDGGVMTRPFIEGSAAQVFFNVASISNLFPTENLQFVMDNVVFEDVDIYTMTGRAANPALDSDFFVPGNTTRQQAGFAPGLFTLTNLPRDTAFITHADLLVSGQFQSSPFNLPEIEGIDVSFEGIGPLTGDGAITSLSPNLVQTPSQLRAVYTIGNSPATGVLLDPNEVYSLISIVFRAVDRAGDYFPRGNPLDTKRKLWTANDTTSEGYANIQQPDMGPLNLWWMRTTGTRVISNVPPNGDARNPRLEWEPNASPSPQGTEDASGEGSERLYSWAVYRTDPLSGLSREQQRDGRYDQVVSWQGWSDRDTVFFDTDIRPQVVDGLVENAWFLLVVMSVDEAGNVELWPVDQLDLTGATTGGTAGDPDFIAAVVETGNEERNWERWWVPPLTETIETTVEPFFWHDTRGTFGFNGAVDQGERTFGDAEVIPYPPPATFRPQYAGSVLNPASVTERVTAQFRVSMITSDPDATITYRVLENGVEIPGSPFVGVIQDPAGGFTVNLVLPSSLSQDTFLGSANRQPTFYTFEAWTVNSDDTADSSPAAVNFVVVDDVADFIKNRRETQSIRESDTN